MAAQDSSVRNMSHGRGGAGNMSKERRDSTTKREDLITPTLKAEHYTTGRGGSGNIARNDPAHPEIARAAQDVEAPPPREPEGSFHYGRGGAANVVNPTAGQVKAARETNDLRRRSPEGGAGGNGVAEDVRGLGEKGKDILGKIVGKK